MSEKVLGVLSVFWLPILVTIIAISAVGTFIIELIRFLKWWLG